MCLILFAHEAHPRYRLVLAANRDEFFDRPTAAALFWADAPGLLAGRDLQGGGTWLGVTRTGRIAALSNFRESPHHRDGNRSRGELPLNFLRDTCSTVDYLGRLSGQADAYSGFNLVVGDGGSLAYISNRGCRLSPVPPGIHGLSNHLLDTPWPKVRSGKELLAQAMGQDTIDPEELLALLGNRTIPPDPELPDTGFGLEWERILSPLFISSPAYGTRASTVVLVDRDETLTFVERTFDSTGNGSGTATFSFRIEP